MNTLMMLLPLVAFGGSVVGLAWVLTQKTKRDAERWLVNRRHVQTPRPKPQPTPAAPAKSAAPPRPVAQRRRTAMAAGRPR